MCIVRPHRFTNITSKSKTAGGVAVGSATPTVGQFINWKSPRRVQSLISHSQNLKLYEY